MSSAVVSRPSRCTISDGQSPTRLANLLPRNAFLDCKPATKAEYGDVTSSRLLRTAPGRPYARPPNVFASYAPAAVECGNRKNVAIS